jgi:LEA14-like dessication related protein
VRRFTHGWLAAVLGMTACATPLPATIESPRVNIADVSVIGMTVLEQRYSFSLRLQNSNTFALPVRGISVSFSINGHEIGHGVSDAAFSLPPLGEVVRDIEVVSDLGRMAQALEARPSGAPVAGDYRLKGRLLLDGRSEPVAFEYRGEVKSSR